MFAKRNFSYQIAYETARKAGYSDGEAAKFMRKSVALAVRARDEFYNVDMQTGSTRPPLVALSLGPYGATLDTAAEFTGLYPPPYGPVIDDTESRSRRGPFMSSEEDSYVDALAAFHFSRLLAYASDQQTWDAIDMLAFETVPLVMEAKAIRIAVGRLERWFHENAAEDVKVRQLKPWYISFVFPGPGGEFVENNPESRGPESSISKAYTPFEVAQATLSRSRASGDTVVPSGLGINCTSIEALETILSGYARAVSKTSREDGRPWLVMYPNGGIQYDTVAKVWLDGSRGKSSTSWANSLVGHLRRDQMKQQVEAFGGLWLGGCCKTAPSDIGALQRNIAC